MLYVDLSHTATTNAHTGVQVVSRRLLHYLSAEGEAEPVVFDPQWGHWRRLDKLEMRLAKGLSEESGEKLLRDAKKWPRRLRGHWWRLTERPAPDLFGPQTGVILPEIFKPGLGRHLDYLREKNGLPVVAIFHDAICLKLPFLSKSSNVERFPFYLSELGQLDGVVAVSKASRDDLLAYWKWLGWRKHPPVEAIPLGTDLRLREQASPHEGGGQRNAFLKGERVDNCPMILCVSSIEGRKNHLLLFDAAEKLWQEGLDFNLRLIGRSHPGTGKQALQRLDRLKARYGNRVDYWGQVSREVLSQAYNDALFTVYPSLMEGFGLPVIESLSFGKVCVCSGEGALGESTAGGGCWPLETLSVDALAEAMRTLLNNPQRRGELENQARARVHRPWEEFAREVRSWVLGLRKFK
jgi:glycosyltransferase involved in cell wall biosynthesis